MISFTLTPSAAVTVTGSDLALTLSNGAQAAYTGQDGSGNLLFNYTVQPGDTTADVLVTGLAFSTTTAQSQSGQALDASALATLAGADTGIAIDSTAPGAPVIAGLDPGSDSGALGDGVTNVTTPIVIGTAEAGSTVQLFDGTGFGATLVGTAVADGSGNWSITSSALADGTHDLTATATDVVGNVSDPSGALALTVDDVAPAVTALASTAENGDPTLTGGGDPNAVVSITENGVVVGTAQADDTGAWSFDAAVLAPGSHALVASETDLAGNVGTAPSVGLAVADPRFDFGAPATPLAGAIGRDYTGPVSYLKAEYVYFGSKDVILGARVDNVFLHGGSGTDALAALGGSNVLVGGAGSNWLVGATGQDGGHDTFFVDGRGGQNTWDTVLNFHVGDMVTLWGYDPASGHIAWSDNQGAVNYTGATLHAAFGTSSGASALITFGGLSTSSAHFTAATGSIGGVDFLMVTRTG